MKITKVKVKKIEHNSIKAFANVTFDDCFVVTGVKVFEGQKGLFVSMPSAKNKKGEYDDICFPITKEFRETLIKAVLAEYEGEDDLPF